MVVPVVPLTDTKQTTTGSVKALKWNPTVGAGLVEKKIPETGSNSPMVINWAALLGRAGVALTPADPVPSRLHGLAQSSNCMSAGKPSRCTIADHVICGHSSASAVSL